MLFKVLLEMAISTSFAVSLFPNLISPQSGTEDSYPPRAQLNHLAEKICIGLKNDQSNIQNQLSTAIATTLNSPTSNFKIEFGDSGGVININIDSKPPMIANIVFDQNVKNFTMAMRRPKTEIEPISRISLNSNCSLFQAYNTYYNIEHRPHLRIKTNAFGEELLRVKMEEPLQEMPASAAHHLKVGFIDSGLDYNHPAVAGKSRPFLGVDLTNPARPPYDYTNTIQNELMGKSYGHGTAVAAIAAEGIDIHIIPVRTENTSHLAGKAVEYLARHGVRIVNISQGTWRISDWIEFREAALAHPEMLFIVAAGNESSNIDKTPAYPASFDIPNMIVVAATDKDGEFSKSFSNYGPQRVHVAAYGENVLTAKSGGGMGRVSGTSFATPKVTRLAAQILMKQQSLKVSELKELVLKQAQPRENLRGKVKYGYIE